MRLPSRERRVLWAKVGAALVVEALVAPPFIALALVAGRAPEPALALQNRLRQRIVRWVFPWAKPR